MSPVMPVSTGSAFATMRHALHDEHGRPKDNCPAPNPWMTPAEDAHHFKPVYFLRLCAALDLSPIP